ncbi:hypothetical protein BJY01DRAFT_217892 [Aspergillus pseudoustus]|uniref:Uncharacterized protein n=1 Tax=Aspergillus pseudoustus TaxID=1810923 RepID=A0ABR4JMA3_9EURO
MSRSQDEWCAVYNPSYDIVAHDPLDPAKRYHEGIFVQLDPETRDGTMFHVTGDVIAPRGMKYEEDENYAGPHLNHLHQNPQIGWVRRADYDSGRFSSILSALPTPTKQQGLDFWGPSRLLGYTEYIWTKENGDPYGPGEQRRPVMKCNEWTHQLAIPALLDAGILHTTR